MNYLKVMSGQRTSDQDTCKDFTLYFIAPLTTHHLSFSGPTRERPVARVEITNTDGNAESFDIHGNAYVLNDDAEVIASFGIIGVDFEPDEERTGAERHKPPTAAEVIARAKQPHGDTL